MRKFVLYISFLGLIICGVYAFYDEEATNNSPKNTDKNNSNITIQGIESSKNDNKLSEEELKKSLEEFNKKIELLDLIVSGDDYFNSDNLILALNQYTKVLEKNPDDKDVTQRVGDILFEMKSYTKASEYYEKIIGNKNFDEKKYILSLIYGNDLTNKSNRDAIINKIKSKIENEEEVFFYSTAINCIESFHACKKLFKDKIKSLDDMPTSLGLQEIQKADQIYENFKIEDISYKDSLYLGTFFKLKLYTIVINLGLGILEEKPDYKAILEVVAQSYFELGDYANADKYLRDYINLEPLDAKAAYLIGVSNLKTSNYMISNIFFKKAIELGFEDKISIQRKKIYNYYMLNDYKYFTNEYLALLDYKDVTIDDYNIYINYLINNYDTENAIEVTKKGVEKFPDEILFYEYLAKFNYEKGSYLVSKAYIQKGLQIDNCSQLLNYYFGLIYRNGGDYKNAKKYMEKAINCELNGELVEDIRAQLDGLEAKILQEKNTNSNSNSGNSNSNITIIEGQNTKSSTNNTNQKGLNNLDIK